MIFNSYFKLYKNVLLKKFKTIQIINYNYKKKKLNILLKSKNSINYIYNKFIYNFNYIKLLYILSTIYNIIFLKFINYWNILLQYKIIYNNIYIIFNIFTYF